MSISLGILEYWNRVRSFNKQSVLKEKSDEDTYYTLYKSHPFLFDTLNHIVDFCLRMRLSAYKTNLNLLHRSGVGSDFWC